MRLYQRALLRETTANSGIALGVISAIQLVIMSVRFVGRAAIGQFDVSAVLPYIVFAYLRFLPVLLSLSLFIGVLLALVRYWQDNEMAIWFGAGLSPRDWIVPLLKLALPIALIIAALSLEVIPWISRQKAQFESYVTSQKQDASQLTPGVFAETDQGKRVYFIEDIQERQPSIGNIFIQSEEHGRTAIISANHGQVETMANGDRFLVLQHGYRYIGTPGKANFQIMEFEHYGFRLEPGQYERHTTSPGEQNSFDLMRNPTPANQAELAWRIGYPISTLILVLLTLPLSIYNPRVGRSYGIILAALIYTLYNNVMNLSQTWVARGEMGLLASQLLVHGLALAFVALAFWWRFGRPVGRKPA